MNNPYDTFGPRLGAFILDAIILAALGLLVLPLQIWTGLADVDVPWTAISLGVASLYNVILHATRGATLGKMALGVEVRRASDLGPIGFREAIIRHLPALLINVTLLAVNLTYAGLAEIPWYLVSMIVVLNDKRSRAPHDRLAGTVVVRTQSLHDAAMMTAAETSSMPFASDPFVLAPPPGFDQFAPPAWTAEPPSPPPPTQPARIVTPTAAPEVIADLDAVTGRRIVAGLVDFAVISTFASILFVPFVLEGRTLMAAAFAATAAAGLYQVLCHGLGGATLGKRAAGLALVAHPGKERANWFQAFACATPLLITGAVACVLLYPYTDDRVREYFIEAPRNFNGDTIVGTDGREYFILKGFYEEIVAPVTLAYGVFTAGLLINLVPLAFTKPRRTVSNLVSGTCVIRKSYSFAPPRPRTESAFPPAPPPDWSTLESPAGDDRKPPTTRGW